MTTSNYQNNRAQKYLTSINSAEYWCNRKRLGTDDLVNYSTVVGDTITAALNTLAAAGSGIPYLPSGLAEQDLLSYDAAQSKWVNRTIARALRGAGTNSILAGTSSTASNTSSIAIGPFNTSAGIRTITIGANNGSASLGGNNILVGTNVGVNATAALTSVVGIGNLALSGPLSTTGPIGTVAVGESAGAALDTAADCTFGGYKSGNAVTTGARNTFYGSNSTSTNIQNTSTDSTVIGAINSLDDRNNAIIVGSQNTVTNNGSITIGVSLTNSGSGALAIGGSVTANGGLAILGTVIAAQGVAVGGLSKATTSGVSVGYKAGNVVTGADNTFDGYQAGQVVTTGARNTFVGSNSGSLIATTTTADNTTVGSLITLTVGASGAVVVGANAVHAAVADGVAIGRAANVTAASSVAIGVTSKVAASGVSIGNNAGAVVTGTDNTFIGAFQGQTVTSGIQNTLIGSNSTANVAFTISSGNTLIGYNITAGVGTASCVAIGNGTNVSGPVSSVAIGVNAAATNTGCVAIGPNSASGSSSGSVAIGNQAKATGTSQISIGLQSGKGALLFNNCIGVGDLIFSNASAASANNTVVGSGAMIGVLTAAAADNSVFGRSAGATLTTGPNNVIIGSGADVSAGARTGCVGLGKGCSLTTDNTFKVALNNGTVTFQSDLIKVVGGNVALVSTDYFQVSFDGGATFKKVALYT